MKNKFLLSLVLVTTLVSCNGKKEEKEPVNEFFSVEVEALASKTDDFTLYFTEDNTTDFKGANAIWRGINGGKVEKIPFVLSVDKIPTNIRLDFGLKSDQDSVVIKNVKVDYYGNDYQFKGSDFFKYFIEDKQFSTKIDQAKGTLTILKKDGIYKAPYYYPTQATIDSIKKITTTPKN